MPGSKKICSKCNKSKSLSEDYYTWNGRPRGECKACTIKKNVKYQKKNKVWNHREEDDEARRVYMRAYYSKNKEKFAEYRSGFLDRHPDYYKEYFRDRKNKK